MCDTFVALGDITETGATIFAKNSDRQRNEAQGIELLPARSHDCPSQLSCTYIDIPQVALTHAAMLSRPYWMWGAEMGVNEHGVAIGNETIHSKAAAPNGAGLTGMDIVRLGLERSRSAADAIEVMTGAITDFGQGGDCGHMTPYYYNNGFLVADAKEAFVIETLGREWFVERVRSQRAISNCYSIGPELERTSRGFDRLLQESGWLANGAEGPGAVLADRDREARGYGEERRQQATAALKSYAPNFRTSDAFAMLRGHGLSDPWNARDELPVGLCVHARGDEMSAQTTGALVAELHTEAPVIWATGTAAPCLSIFKPVLLGTALPDPSSLSPGGSFDEDKLWWAHELLHRRVLARDFAAFLRDIAEERDELEAHFERQVAEVRNGGSNDERRAVVQQCWLKAHAVEHRWTAKAELYTHVASSEYDLAWRKMNLVAQLPS